jgi:hypothetical protein
MSDWMTASGNKFESCLAVSPRCKNVGTETGNNHARMKINTSVLRYTHQLQLED